MLKANYHTHTKLCNHAVGMSKDYIEKAINEGYLVIGMSDHGPLSKDFMTSDEFCYNMLSRHMDLMTFYSIYLPDLDDSIKKYGDKIKILKAVEIEYIKGQDDYYAGLLANLDYLNLGIHCFYSDGKYLNSYNDINTKTIYDYANACKEGMSTGHFKILVHPDLFFFNYKDKDNKNNFDEHCEKVSRIIIESAIKNNVYLEVNANGVSNSRRFRKDGVWGYPTKYFWQIAKEYKDLKIIIGADAHNPDQLACDDLKQTIDFCKELGLKISDFVDI